MVVIVVGTRLLTAGEVIQMWQTADQTSSGSVSGPPVEFYFDEQDSTSAAAAVEWHCVWQCRPANPVTLVKFSSDSLLFATIGKVCCLAGIRLCGGFVLADHTVGCSMIRYWHHTVVEQPAVRSDVI